MANPDIIRPQIWLKQDLISAGFTTRALDRRFNQDGNNYDSLSDKFSVIYELHGGETRLAYAKQVHGGRVVTVNEPGFVGEADGLITTSADMTLAIQVADCGVLLLADRENGIIGALHSGWRGTADGIAGNAIVRMKELGSLPENIEVFIGPCISSQVYEVGEEVASRFDGRFVLRDGFAKPHLAIREALKQQLRDAGIPEINLEIDQRCTYLNPDLFHSYRRDGKKSGRMIGFIRMNNN
ncbi:MAG TPA: peptidoglycan editing factor PgeF [Balneolales bacterium]|nr:peptidoglycan editing factor PgeF [Balneolales bacterium]